MRGFALLVAVCLLAGSVFAADAPRPADFSATPVEIIVPFAAGGGMDATFRVIAKYAEQEMGQPVTVKNVTSGGNIQGNLQAMNAAPDGHVWGTWGLGLVTDELIIRSVTYSHTDVTPVAMVALDSHIICVNAAFAKRYNITDLQGLMDTVAANPGKVLFGAGGNWTTHDFVRLKLQEAAGAEFARMPFLGGALATQAAANGSCDVATPFGPEYLPYMDDPRLAPLAVTSESRIALAADVPTAKESGYPNLVQSIWRLISVPKTTPQPIVRYIASVLSTVMRKPELLDELRRMGINPFILTGEELVLFVEHEYQFFKTKTAEWGVQVER